MGVFFHTKKRSIWEPTDSHGSGAIIPTHRLVHILLPIPRTSVFNGDGFFPHEGYSDGPVEWEVGATLLLTYHWVNLPEQADHAGWGGEF